MGLLFRRKEAEILEDVTVEDNESTITNDSDKNIENNSGIETATDATATDESEEDKFHEAGESKEYSAIQKFLIPREDFGPLIKYIEDSNITDVDYNGQDVWTTDTSNRKIKRTELAGQIDYDFIEHLARKVANAVSKELNAKHPVLEAETKDLRISILHDSKAQSGTSICIRKTPPLARISEKYAIETHYASKEVLSLLANCIKAHMNIVVAGQPRAGKTELAKFLSGFIPNQERVITIEDVMEWRYKQLKPEADCVEIRTDKEFDYSKGIIASLKQNPDWIMIAETRGHEVLDLINGFTTGVNGITTLHTDAVEKIPQRMLNMINDSSVDERVLGNIYEFIDVGIMISFRKDPETGQRYRIIDQIGFFTYEDRVPKCKIVVSDGRFIYQDQRMFPQCVLTKFEHNAVMDIFTNDSVEQHLKEQGYIEKKKPIDVIKEQKEKERAGKKEADSSLAAQVVSEEKGKSEDDNKDKEKQPLKYTQKRQDNESHNQKVSENAQANQAGKKDKPRVRRTAEKVVV